MTTPSHRLTGAQYAEMQSALISAFPSYEALEQMVQIKLGKNLNAIAGGTNLEYTVFELIKRAEAEGWTGDLLHKAHERNPGNAELAALEARLFVATSTSLPAPSPAARDAPARLRTLAPEEMNTLVTAFARCDCLANTESRNLLRGLLPAEFRISVPVSNVLLHDVTGLVTTSIRYKGGFQALLRLVRNLEGPTYSRDDLDTIVVALFPELQSELD